MSWTRAARTARRVHPKPVTGAPAAAARAGVFSVVSTGLALTGHHVASGHPVPWPNAGTALVLLFLLTIPAARGPRSVPTLMAATGAAQAALHLWLTRAVGHSAPTPHPMDRHDTSRGVHDAWHAGHHGVSMTAAHIAAAALVAWCLQRADTACLALGKLGERAGKVIADLLVRPIPAVPLLAPPRVLRPAGERTPAPPYNSLVLAHAVVRRGPPAGPVPAVRATRPRGALRRARTPSPHRSHPCPVPPGRARAPRSGCPPSPSLP
ncbi:hypothetical protein [Streptomyces sp. NPDC093109]|uniref:hypothetical protein n=1 Tax=Streptomyces sp. NPDC093109 TaxID=3154977 RepID=UPI00344D6151